MCDSHQVVCVCMSDIPSMMVSDGTETDSVADTFSSSLFANTALLVFFVVPSQLAREHGILNVSWLKIVVTQL